VKLSVKLKAPLRKSKPFNAACFASLGRVVTVKSPFEFSDQSAWRLKLPLISAPTGEDWNPGTDAGDVSLWPTPPAFRPKATGVRERRCALVWCSRGRWSSRPRRDPRRIDGRRAFPRPPAMRHSGGSNFRLILAGIPGKPSTQTGFGALIYTTSPPTGLLGVGLGGDSTPRMIAFQLRFEF
jgi:hypothetical protein